MRYMIIALLLVMATAASADDAPMPRDIVFGYECGQIDPKVVGFKCEFKGFAPLATTLTWVEDPWKMERDRQARAMYEYEKLALRFFSLGGTRFTAYTASGKRLGCYNSPQSPGIHYTCRQ